MKSREEIYQAVVDGRLDPQTAERLAAEEGFEPFECAPDGPDFDPLIAPDAAIWTPAMVVMWIATRDSDHVREWWDEYRRHWRYWLAPNGSQPHWVLKTAGPGSLMHCRLSEDELGDALSLMDARLQVGMLAASGINQDGKVVEIPAIEWRALRFFADSNGRDVLRVPPGLGVIEYRDVKLRRSDVLQNWRASEDIESDALLFEQPPKTWQEAKDRPKLRAHDEQFDPETISHWSITMALAWIIWRDIRAVREEWDNYLCQCAEWRFHPEITVSVERRLQAIRDATFAEPAPNDPEVQVWSKNTPGVWKFEPFSPSGWLGIEGKAHGDDISWTKKLEHLWQVAGEGRISATALESAPYQDRNAAKIVEIPSHMWARLRCTREPSGRAMLSAPDRDYRDVRFSRLEVKRIWPLHENNDSESDIASDSLVADISDGSNVQTLELETCIGYAPSGKGARGRACEYYYQSFFPNGLPPGVSADQRNTRILNAVVKDGLPKPDKRTIERAVAAVEKRKDRRQQ